MRDTVDLKKNNIRKCTALIWNCDSVTKPQLAGMSELTPVTSHKFINELAEIGFVVEAGFRSSPVGKKALTYEVNPKFGCFVAVYIYDGKITSGLFDFRLRCIFTETDSFPSEYSEQAFAFVCGKVVRAMEYSHGPVLGIGLTLSGQIDFSEGVVTHCTDMEGWNNIPLKAKMENRFAIRTVVENDVNGCAAALKWKNPPSLSSVLICISKGVGTGVVIDGRVYRGKNSFAGELGHVTVAISGKLCKCGNRGCIEEFISDCGILEESGCANMEEAIDAARENDPGITEILANRCEYISVLLDYVVKSYDPQTIYLSSSWLGELPFFFGKMSDMIFSKSNWLKRDKLSIVLLDQREPLLSLEGAAYSIFDYYMEVWNE